MLWHVWHDVAPFLDRVPHFAQIVTFFGERLDNNLGKPYTHINPITQPIGASEMAVNPTLAKGTQARGMCGASRRR